jgi:hypothetical protein
VEPQQAAPPPTDDWSLIRLSNGAAGWVLTRFLVMAIPDDVAQYAEGRRIVSYFPLGEVADGDAKKHNWLWTTIGSGSHDYDFDNFRVFIWSMRRHRYETAYIERNLQGYAPVLLRPVEFAGSKYPGFSICMERKGQRSRRDYAFLGNVVRFAGERPCEALPSATQKEPGNTPLAGGTASEAAPMESLSQRVKRKVKGWLGR